MKSSSTFYPKKILVTGGCGFIGSNFIKYILSLDKAPVVINIDNLTYAGNINNLEGYNSNPNYFFEKGDITDSIFLSKIFKEYSPDSIINIAAESHVDRSITNPSAFFQTNVGGVLELLNLALERNIKRFLQVSTDEVYGSLGSEGYFTEETNLKPNSPYSASKASADNFVRAYHHTYGLNTIITRCSNNYGPYQFPEKLIPLTIERALENNRIPIYGDGKNVRDWIHVSDHCMGMWSAFTKGTSGQIYNFGGDSEYNNLDLVKEILNILKRPENLIEFVPDRLGHDYRYAIDFSKANSDLGWSPLISFEEGIASTIDWYISNKSWLHSIKSGDYRIV